MEETYGPFQSVTTSISPVASSTARRMWTIGSPAMPTAVTSTSRLEGLSASGRSYGTSACHTHWAALTHSSGARVGQPSSTKTLRWMR